MEAKILLLSQNAKKLQGDDVCSYTFKLNPPLNLSEPGDFHCALSYLAFMQLNIDFEDEVYMEIGSISQSGQIHWSGHKHSILLLDTSVEGLLDKINKWQAGIDEFDGTLQVSVEKVKGTNQMQFHAKMFTDTKPVRLSPNLARFLGFYRSEFPPNIVQGEESTISPGWSRWKEGPLLLDLSIIEETGMEQFGAETQIPDGDSNQSVRCTYLAIVPLIPKTEAHVGNVLVQIQPRGGQLRWVRARQSTISHITVTMRWPTGDLVYVDSHFRLVCEILIKRRKMLAFV